MTGPVTKPRNGRRESTAGPGIGSKVRKNSIASGNAGVNTSHSRRNTISHIDMSSLGLLDSSEANLSLSRVNSLGGPVGLGHHMNIGMGGLPNSGFFNGISNDGLIHGLPKIDTHINYSDIPDSLRTAPVDGSFHGFDLDQLFTPNTTINPAALHYGEAGAVTSSNIPFGFDPSTNQQVPIDDDFGWMRNWNMHMNGGSENEQAIEESSPSRMSSGDSPGEYAESMTHSQPVLPMHNNFQWQQQQQKELHPRSMSTGNFHLESLGPGMPNLGLNGTLSPSSLHDPTPTGDTYFHQAMMQHNGGQQQPSAHARPQADSAAGQSVNFFVNPLTNISSNSPSIASSAMSGSARHSSLASVSTDSITESTRQALLSSLNQPSVFGGHNSRKYSQPAISSPLSPANARASSQAQGPTLPDTADIRRYIEAFVRYAMPHLPLTHIPTLSFDGIEVAAGPHGTPSPPGLDQAGRTGGARCLILGMAAIGALYEYDHIASKGLFEAAKKMIQLYLEERRKADMSKAVNGSVGGSGETPLWLVQAMLFTVIYGHHCGDRLAADIASNHIAALVSLARAANLAQPPMSPDTPEEECEQKRGDVEMADAISGDTEDDLHAQWIKWKLTEERKRCLFAIFILSSLLTTSYNQTPTIMNSEILLDLPCAEELYNAPTAESWQALGGLAAVEAGAISFATALSTLLSAHNRQPGTPNPEDDIKPSTFGCLVLINALHNYIWETRSRRREWTMQETESMVAYIEPALNAWQTAWKANEHHRLERPNPFGLGPLSADSIPLLDLAFVRLYVDMGRTAEAFWRRDFDQMAEALGHGSRLILSSSSDKNNTDNKAEQSRRERHLRKAAFYAADSLSVACRFNLTYADPTAHELPIQSAICFFDCVQVLAEWCTTVQERVGKYLGVLGRDAVEYTQVPAIMLLETEDAELLRKIEGVCGVLEGKRREQENLLSIDMGGLSDQHAVASMSASTHNGVDLGQFGVGSRILRVTAMMLEKAVIWPSKCARHL